MVTEELVGLFMLFYPLLFLSDVTSTDPFFAVTGSFLEQSRGQLFATKNLIPMLGKNPQSLHWNSELHI